MTGRKGRYDGYRRYRIYDDMYGFGVCDDTGACVFLWRDGARKNVVNTMMGCVSIMGLAIVMWCAFGYSLAFGQDHGGVIGI